MRPYKTFLRVIFMHILPFFPPYSEPWTHTLKGWSRSKISSCDKSDEWLILWAVRARWCCTVGSHMCRTAWWIRLADGKFTRHPWTYSESTKEEEEETAKCICTRCKRASQMGVWAATAGITSTHLEPAFQWCPGLLDLCLSDVQGWRKSLSRVFKPQKMRLGWGEGWRGAPHQRMEMVGGGAWWEEFRETPSSVCRWARDKKEIYFWGSSREVVTYHSICHQLFSHSQ